MLASLVEAHEGEILFVYRHFPLTFHDKSALTAEAAEAAGAQGAFWEMHDLLFQRYAEWANLPVDQALDVMVNYAKELDLDTEQFRQDLENHTYLQKVQESLEEAKRLNLPGTPTFFVNGRMYPFGLGLSGQALEFFIQLSKEAPPPYDAPPPQVIDPERQYLATIRTTQGDIVVELYPGQSPINVNQFVFLAQEGWYDGNSFFRVITDTAILSGDPTDTGILMDPGYRCEIEISPDLKFDAEGIVGLVNTTRGTTSSQFFITLSPQPDLDGHFTIIGKVIEGLDVVRALTPPDAADPEATPGDRIETIVIEEQ